MTSIPHTPAFSDSHPWDITPSDCDGDTLHEECGIFGVIGARSASSMAALGLHALQHRGQEAVGITSFDGNEEAGEFFSHRGIGHVAQVFNNQDMFADLPGQMASGHVRYSTTGGSGLRNVQPLFADLADGGFSIAHNGNISNAMTLKRDLVQKGSIFQSTSDTEVIIHLVATSLSHAARSLHRCAAAGGRRLFADLHDQRGHDRLPRSAGHPPAGDGPHRRCHRVRQRNRGAGCGGRRFRTRGGAGRTGGGGSQGRDFQPSPFGNIAAPCIFEQVYFSRPDLDPGRTIGVSVAPPDRRGTGQGSPANADLVVPVPDRACPPPSAMRRKAAFPPNWASSAATMSAAPSSSPATASAMPR
jgi:amidophosphoribosyltransferase